MDLRFIAQPNEGGTDLRDFLEAVATDHDMAILRIVVAWAKRSGVRRVAADLKAIRARGGKVLAIVGVSEGGATEQGLQAVLDEADEAHVFHDAGRTFHPKVYLAEDGDRALLLVGSHNLTAGGLAWNYEAGLWCELDLSVDADRMVRDDVVAYFDELRADSEVCKPLDSASLTAILADPKLLIQDEDSRSRPPKQTPDTPEETDSTEIEDEALPSYFGKSANKKRKAPSLPTLAPKKAPKRNPAPAAGAVPGSLPELDLTHRWSKLLDGTAAQKPPGATTNPTGNLRLSQEGFSIDHRTYFRQVFFNGLDWRPSARVPDMEELWLPFETEVGGDYLGAVNLRVSHLPSRIAGQNNVPTVLHWGDLGRRLRENNYVGKYVSLERGSGGQAALIIIGDAPTGPFMY